jgi:hypothetical protein
MLGRGGLVSDAVPLEHGALPQPQLSQRREGKPWRTSLTGSTDMRCLRRSRPSWSGLSCMPTRRSGRSASFRSRSTHASSSSRRSAFLPSDSTSLSRTRSSCCARRHVILAAKSGRWRKNWERRERLRPRSQGFCRARTTKELNFCPVRAAGHSFWSLNELFDTGELRPSLSSARRVFSRRSYSPGSRALRPPVRLPKVRRCRTRRAGAGY